MIPYINLYFGKIPTFVIFALIGTLSLFFVTHIVIRKSKYRTQEENYIFPKIVIAGFVGFLSSGFFDSLFKIGINGGIKFGGITFYGGLIGSLICIILLLNFFKKNTHYSIYDWVNILTVPLVVFHFFGRVGCFFAGCCYGKITDSILGVAFPDNPDAGIYHYGMKCYPTQIFELISILLIFLIVIRVKNKFCVYLFIYSIARFVIEFFRGDERGYVIDFLSPAQFISVIFFILSFIMLVVKKRTGRI